jgi:hypothetical protein
VFLDFIAHEQVAYCPVAAAQACNLQANIIEYTRRYTVRKPKKVLDPEFSGAW